MTNSVHEDDTVRFLETKVEVGISFSNCLLTEVYWMFFSEASSLILPHNLHLCTDKGGSKATLLTRMERIKLSWKVCDGKLGRREYAASR